MRAHLTTQAPSASDRCDRPYSPSPRLRELMARQSALWGLLIFLAASGSHAQPAQFTHQVTDGFQTYEADFQASDVRSSNFQVLVQQADGSFSPHTARAPATYVGSIQGVPGASANALVRQNGEIYYHVYFEDGTEWIYEGGGTTVLSEVLSASNWPHHVPGAGGAGSDIYAAEVGVDLPSDRLGLTHGGDIDAAVEMIEHSVLSANMVYLRDAGLMHHLGRVIIRGSQATDPYSGFSTHDDYLNTLTQQWETVLAAGTHDLALVVRATDGAGLAGVGTIGSPPGYSSNDATTGGDFSRTWRHEAGHNWSLGHFDGGAPEGSTINSGNALASMSGPEQVLVTSFRDRRLAFLENTGPFPIALPPQAATDNAYVSASTPTTIIDILANDHDANGDGLELVSVSRNSDLSLGGTMTLVQGGGPGGRDAVRYTNLTPAPPPTSAIDRFQYRVRDSSGREAVGYVFVRLTNFTERYAQDFSGLADGTTDLGDGSFITNVLEGSTASVQGGALELTPDELWRLSAYTLPVSNLEGGYEAQFQFRMDSQNAPADVLALNFGDPIPSANGQSTSRFSRGLTVEFVTYPSQEYRVQIDGVPVPQGVVPAGGLVDGQWHTVAIDWRPQPSPADGAITLTVDGAQIFTGLSTPGFTAQSTDLLAFAARTGGLSQRVRIDNVTAGPRTSGTAASPEAPVNDWRLDQNYPNPFSSNTTIEFSVAKPGPVRLAVYDLVGRRIAVLADRTMPVGRQQVSWNAGETGLPDGVYFYRIETEVGQKVRQLVLMR